MRQGVSTAATHEDSGAWLTSRQAPVGVVHAHDERVERSAARLRRGLRLAVGVVVDEAQEVADDVGLGTARRHRDDLARIVDAPDVPQAPGHHAAAQRRGPGEAVALPGQRQPVGDPCAPAEVLQRDRQHELGRREAVRRPGDELELVQPSLGHGEVQPLDDAADGLLGRCERLVARARPQQLVGGLLVVPLPQQQLAVRAAQRPDLARRPPAEALHEVLAEARMRAHAAAVLLPGHRQVPGAQAHEQLSRAGDAQRLRPLGGDLVEHRGHLQQLALGGRQARQDLRGEVAVQRVGLAADALDVVGRPPGLEEHAGHPAAGVGDGPRRVDALAPCALERLRGLLRRERERRLAHGRDAADRAALAEVDADVRAAQQGDPQGRGRVAHERPDHRQRGVVAGEPLEPVHHEQHRDAGRRLGEQPGRLRVRDARRERVRRHVARGGRAAREGRLEVGQQPAGRRVRVVERQPRRRAVEQRGRLDHRRGLAGAGGRRDQDERVTLEQLGDEPADPRPGGEALAQRGHRQLALDHGGRHRRSSSRGAHRPIPAEAVGRASLLAQA